MRTLTLTSLLLLACFLAISDACSCVAPFPSREETIRSFFRSSRNIYTARVVRADCKCYGADGDQSNGLLSCRQYSLNSQGNVLRATPRQYSCMSGSGFGFPFRKCSLSLNQIARGRTVMPVQSGTEPPINTTGQMNCGVSGVESETVGQSCDLTPQPCYYMVTIVEVFKGNYSTGQSLSVSGPDVLSSCGNQDRVLSLGVDYIAGIGSGCHPISGWENTTQYSTSGLQLMRDLQECSMNPMSSACSGTSLVATHIGMGLLTVLLTVTIAVIVGSY